jgi:hypothetical protein
MGVLTSTPKLPKLQQQPVYNYTIPPATVTPPAATAPATNDTAADAPAESDGDVQAKAREENLLSRSRGVLSTVMTGFRGLLSDTVSQTPRKSLLGE